MKDSYSKREVVELLVGSSKNTTDIFSALEYFVIKDEVVICYRKSFFGDKELSRRTFDEIIDEAEHGILSCC